MKVLLHLAPWVLGTVTLGACDTASAPAHAPPPSAESSAEPGTVAENEASAAAASSAAAIPPADTAPTVPKGQSRGMTPDFSIAPRQKSGPRPAGAGGTRGEQVPPADHP